MHKRTMSLKSFSGKLCCSQSGFSSRASSCFYRNISPVPPNRKPRELPRIHYLGRLGSLDGRNAFLASPSRNFLTPHVFKSIVRPSPELFPSKGDLPCRFSFIKSVTPRKPSHGLSPILRTASRPYVAPSRNSVERSRTRTSRSASTTPLLSRRCRTTYPRRRLPWRLRLAAPCGVARPPR